MSETAAVSSAASASTDAPTPSLFSRRLSELLLWLLLVLVTFSLPKPPELQLDASWRMALGYFLEQGFAFGRDVVFTYGPLGFLLGRTYTADFFWPLILWQLFLAAVTATVVLRLSRGLAGLSRFCFLAFFILFGLGYEDALHTMLIVLFGWSLIDKLSTSDRPLAVVAPALFFAFLAAIKFTNLMLAGFVVAVVTAFGFVRRRNLAAWLFLGIFSFTFLLIWSVCQQPISALVPYFFNSLDVSSGYQATMGLPTPFAPFWKALVMIALLLGYLAWHLRTQPDRIRSCASFLILGAFLYLNWKHGIVRADGHMLGFFYCALLICLAFPALFREIGESRWIARALLVPAAILGLLGIYNTLPPVLQWAGNIANEKLVRNLQAVSALRAARQHLDNQLAAEREKAALPKTARMIGDASIDVLGFEQGVALFNQFNYTPRPVFQSYSAYTPHLNRLNADWLASSQASEYALFKLQTIDERPLLLDDADLLRLFPHYYRFVLEEHGYQLWRRRPNPPPAEQLEPRPLTRVSVAVGQTYTLGDLENKPLWFQVDLPPSLLGRARNFLYKPPLVDLQVTASDNKTETYRLPIKAAQGGFQLNPLVTDIASYLESQGGESQRWVRSVTLDVDSSDRRYFADAASFTFSAVTPSKAKPEYDQQLVRAKFSMFSLIPDETVAFTPPSEQVIDGRQALVMHAPSLMVFTPPPGATRAQGFFGYVPGAYLDGGNTDGAEYRIVWAAPDGERRTLFSRMIRPVQDPADRGLQTFDVDLSNLPAGGQLLLEITAGPANEHSWDWTAWADVVIQ